MVSFKESGGYYTCQKENRQAPDILIDIVECMQAARNKSSKGIAECLVESNLGADSISHLVLSKQMGKYHLLPHKKALSPSLG